MYSFDVFDTLITRKTAVPGGIFAVMQSELGREEYEAIPESIRNNFYQLRIIAEKLARYSYQRNGIEDVTLEQIYAAFAVRGELSEAQQTQLMLLESDIEYRECVPIEKNVNQVKKLLSDGETVILISDMYLPKTQIYKMLEKADPVLTELQLYVSGDCKKRKGTGAIYEFAMEQSHFTGAECIHTGDNEKKDIAAAEKAGFRTRLSWFPDLLLMEKKFLDQTPGNLWLNRVIGCSRRARLEIGEEMAQKDAVQIGTSAGGIILNSYMQWVIRSALARKIKRLYFIAPDGYVLKRIADILIRKTGMAIDTYYSNEISDAKQEMGFSDDRFALVTMSEKSCIRKCLPDLSQVQTFFFSVERLSVTDDCINFVFYPGRIRNRDILEQFYEISEKSRDYLAGIEKYTELFCEDGYMIVQSEDIEQISKMLVYITETQDELYGK